MPYLDGFKLKLSVLDPGFKQWLMTFAPICCKSIEVLTALDAQGGKQNK